MANISISDLSPTGFDLFMDSDTFLKELNDNEFMEITGGMISPFLPSVVALTPSFL